MRFPNIWVLNSSRTRIFRVKTVYSYVRRSKISEYEENSPWIADLFLTVEGSDRLNEKVDIRILRVGPFDGKILDEACKVCKDVGSELLVRFLRYMGSKYKENDIVDMNKVMTEVASPRFIESAINKSMRNLNAKSIDVAEIKITSPFLK